MVEKRLNIPEELLFYLSAPHECSYLQGREAVTLFADPAHKLEPGTFSTLCELGFRRSGGLVYMPRCSGCQACIPVRIPVEQFTPNRSQRRNWQNNSDLTIALTPPQFNEEHIALYHRYIKARHPDGSMDVERREEVERFFLCDWSNTLFLEMRAEERLVGLAIVDVIDSGLSAVYTFYDPQLEKRGLGTYAVQAMIAEVSRRKLPYLYLGYLIHESPKMAYKAGYRPLQQLRNGQWIALDALP